MTVRHILKRHSVSVRVTLHYPHFEVICLHLNKTLTNPYLPLLLDLLGFSILPVIMLVRLPLSDCGERYDMQLLL